MVQLPVLVGPGPDKSGVPPNRTAAADTPIPNTVNAAAPSSDNNFLVEIVPEITPLTLSRRQICLVVFNLSESSVQPASASIAFVSCMSWKLTLKLSFSFF